MNGRRIAVEIEFSPKYTPRLADIVSGYRLSSYERVSFYVVSPRLGARLANLAADGRPFPGFPPPVSRVPIRVLPWPRARLGGARCHQERRRARCLTSWHHGVRASMPSCKPAWRPARGPAGTASVVRGSEGERRLRGAAAVGLRQTPLVPGVAWKLIGGAAAGANAASTIARSCALGA
jgi:hypothetical protein